MAGVAVSLLTNSMQVDYTPDADPDTTAKRICNAVEAAGYGASLATAESENAELEDTETPKLKKRLIASLCFLVPLMYVSMGHMIGLPLPSFMEGHGSGAMVFALVQLALTLPVCWINRAFFISGWKGIKSRAPGMDALVSMGAGAALLYGLYAIVMIGIGLKNDDMELIMQYRHDLYFESAATILTLITVGKTLEAYSKGKTTDALKSLMKLAPQTDSLCAARWRADNAAGQRGADRGSVSGTPGRIHPRGRHCYRGYLQRERGRPDRREHAGG